MAYQKVVIAGLDTAKLTVLTEAEKMALLREMQETGSAEAREKLILGNLRLVLSVIQRFPEFMKGSGLKYLGSVCSVAVSQDGKCIFEREERVDIGSKEHAAAEQKPRHRRRSKKKKPEEE